MVKRQPPPGITIQDWEKTPISVQTLVYTLLAAVEEMQQIVPQLQKQIEQQQEHIERQQEQIGRTGWQKFAQLVQTAIERPAQCEEAAAQSKKKRVARRTARA